jgi:hypothetical protein
MFVRQWRPSFTPIRHTYNKIKQEISRPLQSIRVQSN